jgi:hypothetical protein
METILILISNSLLQEGICDAGWKRFVRVSSFGYHLLMKTLMNASLQNQKQLNESTEIFSTKS